jgi:protein involved in plasmid replication-relaxation
MQLTDRDRRVLWHLASARWLSTGQVAALCFPRVSRTMACRRLRLMRGARFVRTVQENPMMESLHALGARGRQTVGELGYESQLAPERHPPANRRHFLGINDIRIAVLASAPRVGVALNFFFASWELLARGWPYAIVPDAAAEAEREGHTAKALFEYDRATEGLEYLIERKLKRYAEGLDGFAFARVITVVDEPRRQEQLVERTARTIADRRFTFVLRAALEDWSLRELWEPTGSGERSVDRSGAGTVLRA